MTEKRFKISIGEFEEENISDTVKNIEITEISDMCTQMNTLYEENEQLKKDREELFIRERDTKNDWRELRQENESLKEENKFLRNKIKTYKSGNALLKKTLDKEWK